MATITGFPPTATDWTAADLVDRFGPIPLWRVRREPAPGAATEQDVLDVYARETRLCELVDGVLVEKALGVQESFLAVLLARLIGNFVEAGGLGVVLGADGMARLAPGLIRIPDVSFVAWERFPDRRVPSQPFLTSGPDLAVEVLSPSNTPREMSRKLADYFAAGVRLVWYVDPAKRTVEVFEAADRSVLLKDGDVLSGGDVLPGFGVPVARLFENLGPAAA